MCVDLVVFCRLMGCAHVLEDSLQLRDLLILYLEQRGDFELNTVTF